jgi:serine O-acetyltransferase
MISSKLDLYFYREADRIISGRKKKKFSNYLRFDPIGAFMYFLRSVEYYENCQTNFIGRLFKKYHSYRFKRISLKLGFSIPPNVFGPGLYIPHYGTIVVNHNCSVGANCVLHTSVCIAGNKKKILGDNIYISTGSILTGELNINDNVTISSNSLVNKSFSQKNILLGGSPATILKERQTWFIEDGSVYLNRIVEIEKVKKSIYGLKI